MNDLDAYILAGGKSSRFGADKARALIDGQPMILHLARLLETIATTVTVVADKADKYADLELTGIADLACGCGPMGGLEAALKHLNAERDWLLLISCDLVIVKPAWIEALLEARRPSARAVSFRPDGWQPLLALYHRDLLPTVEAHLQSGELAMRALLDSIDAVEAPLPADWPQLLQINTPSDYQRWLKRASS